MSNVIRKAEFGRKREDIFYLVGQNSAFIVLKTVRRFKILKLL